MSRQAISTMHLDPEHMSCIGGRTVLTCRDCAGNAPRGAICGSCKGRGFNIFICAHCNPAAAAVAVRNPASYSPGSSAPSSPGSLSRSSSTSVSSRNDIRTNKPWKRFDDGDDGSGGGRIGTSANIPRSV